MHCNPHSIPAKLRCYSLHFTDGAIVVTVNTLNGSILITACLLVYSDTK